MQTVPVRRESYAMGPLTRLVTHFTARPETKETRDALDARPFPATCPRATSPCSIADIVGRSARWGLDPDQAVALLRDLAACFPYKTTVDLIRLVETAHTFAHLTVAPPPPHAPACSSVPVLRLVVPGAADD